MTTAKLAPLVSVIVPARNEESCLANCLRTLLGQDGLSYEVIVVDDHSSDATAEIARGFPVNAIEAGPLPPGWSGKCNAAWSGAEVAKGKWLLFTDADTKHAANSVASGLREALECDAALLSYSPKQEVHTFAERALMPVIFAELAETYRPKDVSDPRSPAAAANGQYLLIRRDVYDAIGGHASVAGSILEDVELARRVKSAGYRLCFRTSDTVSTRMYRSFPQMWEGWTKNLALLFLRPLRLAAIRMIEFAVILSCAFLAVLKFAEGENVAGGIATALCVLFLASFLLRIRKAHFDWQSCALALFGLPLFALLLLNSDISHKRGLIRWKGRSYGKGEEGNHPQLPGTEDALPVDSPAISRRKA